MWTSGSSKRQGSAKRPDDAERPGSVERQGNAERPDDAENQLGLADNCQPRVSPLRDRAIPMSPYRIFPAMRIFIFFYHQRFVYLHAKPRFHRKVYKTADKSEILLIIDIIQDTLPDVVVDPDTLLLKHAIITDRIDLQAGRQRDRSKRAVRRQRHIVGFRHRANLFHLCDPAGM